MFLKFSFLLFFFWDQKEIRFSEIVFNNTGQTNNSENAFFLLSLKYARNKQSCCIKKKLTIIQNILFSFSESEYILLNKYFIYLFVSAPKYLENTSETNWILCMNSLRYINIIHSSPTH